MCWTVECRCIVTKAVSEYGCPVDLSSKRRSRNWSGSGLRASRHLVCIPEMTHYLKYPLLLLGSPLKSRLHRSARGLRER